MYSYYLPNESSSSSSPPSKSGMNSSHAFSSFSSSFDLSDSSINSVIKMNCVCYCNNGWSYHFEHYSSFSKKLALITKEICVSYSSYLFELHLKLDVFFHGSILYESYLKQLLSTYLPSLFFFVFTCKVLVSHLLSVHTHQEFCPTDLSIISEVHLKSML